MKRLLLLSVLLGVTPGCSKKDQPAPTREGPEEQKPHLRLQIDPPRVAVGKDAEGDAPCRVVFVFFTPGSSPPLDELRKIPVRVSLRPYGAERQGCVYEARGHPEVLRTLKELGDLLARGAEALGKAYLPPVLLRVRGDVRWRHVVRACRAAELAGFPDVQVDPSAGWMKLEVIRPGRQAPQRTAAADRVVIRIPAKAKGQSGADAFLPARAGSYWLDDRSYAPEKVDAVSRWVATRLAEAGEKGRKTLEIEIRADRELAWGQIAPVLAELPKLTEPARRGEGPWPPDPPITPGRRRRSEGFAGQVVYVIDRSGSMVDRFEDVCYEILLSIARLRKDQHFHVIFFGKGEPEELRFRRLVPATPKNKEAAAEFLDSIRAGGLADPIAALKRAFEVLAKADAKEPGKLICLLTDGDFPDNAAVLALVRKLNKDKSVWINTYLYDNKPPAAVKLMKQIAKENGGRYRFVSEDE